MDEKAKIRATEEFPKGTEDCPSESMTAAERKKKRCL